MTGRPQDLSRILQHVVKAATDHDGVAPLLSSLDDDEMAKLMRVFLTGYRVGTHPSGDGAESLGLRVTMGDDGGLVVQFGLPFTPPDAPAPSVPSSSPIVSHPSPSRERRPEYRAPRRVCNR